MKQMRGYKFRIYPNERQRRMIQQTFGCTRFVYNHFLAIRREKYVSYVRSSHMLTQLKRDSDFAWLKEADSTALVESLRMLERAFQSFYQKRSGIPKFKSKHSDVQSYHTRWLRIVDGNIKLPKIGVVKTKLSRKIEGRVIRTTVIRSASGKYFVSLDAEVDVPIEANQGHQVGIDVGLKRFYADDRGNIIANPCVLKKLESRLSLLYKRLARKKEGSMNYKWEEINNEKFEEIGLETRISSKSLKEQRENLIAEGRYEEAEALNREPAKHMGPAFKYPDVQEEVMAMVNEIENERTENQRLAEEQVVATLKRKGISCEGMEYDTENKKNEFDEEKTERTSNDTTIENKKISRETFERLVSLQYQKLQDERRVKREEKKQAHANEDLSKQIFELKKEIMAEDIILRRAVKRAQLDKAELDKRRYKKIMFQLKKYGFDESIATDGVIITVHDICKELGELKKRELEKVSQLEEKIQKRNERVQINTPDEVLAMDRLTDGEYSKTMNKLNGLNDEIKELRKVTRAPVEDVKDYLAKCKEEDTITKKRDQAQEIIDKQLAKAHGGLKGLYDSYLNKIAKEKKIAEKYNEGDRKAIRKHQQLADLLDERRKALAKEFPKEKFCTGKIFHPRSI